MESSRNARYRHSQNSTVVSGQSEMGGGVMDGSYRDWIVQQYEVSDA
ncbi:Unknown protein sequence [Pseudomonas syringae pv. syringae]|nr:Unknown protein sequence [Pseudomonas syringae pv. syringae]